MGAHDRAYNEAREKMDREWRGATRSSCLMLAMMILMVIAGIAVVLYGGWWIWMNWEMIVSHVRAPFQ